MEWISVKDRVPPLGRVLARFCIDNNTRVEIVSYTEHGFEFYNVPIDAIVTHWMPLPEYPNENK